MVIELSKYRRRGRVGALFWEDGSNTSKGSLNKPIVSLTTTVVKDKRLSTITSRIGNADSHDIVRLQKDVDRLLKDISIELKNTLSIGTCTTDGARKVGSLISDFVDSHQEHIITNFPMHITREIRSGIGHYQQKIWDADVGRLIVLFKNINISNAIAYPELWRITRNKLMQLEKANQLVTFTKWYKKNYTKSYEKCAKKIEVLLQ